MTKIYFVLSFLIFSLFAFGQAIQAPLTISHLTGDFYIYTTYKAFEDATFPANGMYIVEEEGIVMIDGPWDSTQLHPLLDSISRRHEKPIIMCIATHYHDDRTGSFEELSANEIKTYSSKQTQKLCIEKHEPKAQYTFTPDTTFQMRNHPFQVIYAGEGHSPDNIVIWFPKDKILYGGCLVKSTESPNLGNLSDANPISWTNTIKKVQKLCPHPKYIIPGHFAWKSKKSLTHTLHLLKQYNRTMQK